MSSGILCRTILAVATQVTSFCWGQSLTIEAESGVISAPFAITNGYVYQPLQTGVTNGGRAVYNITITNAGRYAIMALAHTPSASSNSFFVTIDAEPKDPGSIWEFPAKSGFEEHLISCRGFTSPLSHTAYTLSEGAHQLIIRGRGADARLDRLLIIRSLESPPAAPAAPSNLRIVTSP